MVCAHQSSEFDSKQEALSSQRSPRRVIIYITVPVTHLQGSQIISKLPIKEPHYFSKYYGTGLGMETLVE